MHCYELPAQRIINDMHHTSCTNYRYAQITCRCQLAELKLAHFLADTRRIIWIYFSNYIHFVNCWFINRYLVFSVTWNNQHINYNHQQKGTLLRNASLDCFAWFCSATCILWLGQYICLSYVQKEIISALFFFKYSYSYYGCLLF